MDILIIVLQLILSLSILIVLHELGHYIPAKLFKTRVEKFYLFFDPWFSLFKIKRGDTEYGVGWLPLGGYVKISGMIDESMDKEQLKKEPQPYEFRAKPAWQRLIIMIGGVTVNVFLAVVIYIILTFINGEEYLSNDNAKYGIVCGPMAVKMGLENEDHILGYDDRRFGPEVTFNEVVPEFLLDKAETILVLRDGQEKTIQIPDGFFNEFLDQGKEEMSFFIEPAYPAVIDSITAESHLEEAGFQKGDQIIALNNQPLKYYAEFVLLMKGYKEDHADLTVLRGADTITNSVALITTGDRKLIGFQSDAGKYLEITNVKYGFFASVPKGFSRTWETFTGYLKQFKLIFDSEIKGYKHLGGFGTIASLFPPQWDWTAFWSLTAFLSIMLAFLNLLPIPALDGGHVLFTLYEIVTKRKPNQKFLEYAQVVGMVILLALVLFANGNDIYKKFFN